jgi:hypothetical protein
MADVSETQEPSILFFCARLGAAGGDTVRIMKKRPVHYLLLQQQYVSFLTISSP